MEEELIVEPRTYAGWRIWVQRNKPHYIDSGSFRTVYALDENRVLKLDHAHEFDSALGCNTEAAFWNLAQLAAPALVPHLAPVLSHGDHWLTMARASGTLGYAEGTFPRLEAFTEEVNSWVGDISGWNVGHFGDSLKMIDYGCLGSKGTALVGQ